MKSAKKTFGIILSFLGLFLLNLIFETKEVLAQVTSATTSLGYRLLTGLPGIQNDPSSLSFAQYLNGIFGIFLGLASVLAVLMITVSGIEYMITASDDTKTNAKKKIGNALGGLVLALGSWLLLYTINPQLVRFDLQLEKIVVPENETYTPPTIPWGDDESLRQYLLATYGIEVKQPSCTELLQTNCTSVYGWDDADFRKLAAIKQECERALNSDCKMVITGGSEYWLHKSHDPFDSKFVDFRKGEALSEYIRRNSSCNEKTPIGTLYKVGNNSYVDEGDHWHACIGEQCRITNWSPSC